MMHASQFAFLLIQESFESSAPETIAVAEGTAAVPSTGNGPFLHNVWQNIRSNFNTETVAETLMNWGPPLVSAIAVFILGRMISRVMSGMIVKGSRRAKIDETLARFLGNLAYIMMLTAVCIASLGCLGVDTTSLSAVLAAAGFAVGMALQGSLGNVAAGVLLVFFKPFKVGDMIDVGGTLGKVVEIQIFNTILLSPDNVRIVLPNSSITGGTIRNMSAEPIRRVDLVIGCSYNDDLRAVRAFLEEIVKADSRILLDPAPVVAVSELAESSVNFVVRPWVASADYGNVKFALTEAIKLGFDERGFTIPFPSRDVFVHHSGNMPLSILEGAAAAAAA